MTIQEYKRYLDYIDIKEKENTLLPYITDELLLEIQTVSESEKSDKEWKKYYEEYLLSKYRDLTIDDRSPARLSILNSAFRKMELNECNKIEELNKEEIQNLVGLIYLTSAFIRNEKIPQKIKETSWNLISVISKPSSYKNKLLTEVLKGKNPSDVFLFEIASSQQDSLKAILGYLSDTHSKQKQQTEEISIETKDRLGKCVIDAISCNPHVLYLKKYISFLSLLPYHTSQNIAEQIVHITEDKEYGEATMTSFVCNKNIPEKVRDSYFDRYGCDPSLIDYHTVTPHMAYELSKQMLETLFEYEENERAQALCKIKFYNILTCKTLPRSISIDIANRLISEKSGKYKDMQTIFARMTTSPESLRILSKSKDANFRNIICTNPNCPEDIKQKRIEELLKDIEEHPQDKEQKEQLLCLAKITVIDDSLMKKIYKTLIKEGYLNTDIFFSVKKITNKALNTFSRPTVIIDGEVFHINKKDRLMATLMRVTRLYPNLNRRDMISIYNSISNTNNKENIILEDRTNKYFQNYISIIKAATKETEYQSFENKTNRFIKKIKDIPKDKIREFALKEKIKELQNKMVEEDFIERMVTVINNQETLKEYDRLQHGIDKEMNIKTYDIDFEI